jgi:hypothetical protein
MTRNAASSTLIQIGDRHPRAFLSKKLCDSLADIAARAGHDGDLILQSH